MTDLPYPARTQAFRAVDVIRKKRDGQELSRAEIHDLVAGYTSGRIPDYQISAWLMAAVVRGLSRAETAALTDAMLHSGQVLDLSEFSTAKIDKHSTGGVGDKTSLVLAPLAAAGGLVGPYDQRPRARTYGGHTRQARIDTRLPGRPRAGAVSRGSP